MASRCSARADVSPTRGSSLGCSASVSASALRAWCKPSRLALRRIATELAAAPGDSRFDETPGGLEVMGEALGRLVRVRPPDGVGDLVVQRPPVALQHRFVGGVGEQRAGEPEHAGRFAQHPVGDQLVEPRGDIGAIAGVGELDDVVDGERPTEHGAALGECASRPETIEPPHQRVVQRRRHQVGGAVTGHRPRQLDDVQRRAAGAFDDLIERRQVEAAVGGAATDQRPRIGRLERPEGDRRHDLTTELERLLLAARHRHQAVWQVVGQLVEHRPRRGIDAVDIVHDERRAPAIPAATQRGDELVDSRLLVRLEGVRHRHAEHVQRAQLVAGAGMERDGGPFAAELVDERLDERRLADAWRPGDDDGTHAVDSLRGDGLQRLQRIAPVDQRRRVWRGVRCRAETADDHDAAVDIGAIRMQLEAIVDQLGDRRTEADLTRCRDVAQAGGGPQRLSGDAADHAGRGLRRCRSLENDDAVLDAGASRHAAIGIGEVAQGQRGSDGLHRGVGAGGVAEARGQAVGRLAGDDATVPDHARAGDLTQRRENPELLLGVGICVGGSERQRHRHDRDAPTLAFGGGNRSPAGNHRQLLAEDPALQFADRRTRLEAELVTEAATQLLVGDERVRLTSGLVLGGHQLCGEALVEGMRLDGVLDLGDHRVRQQADLAVEQLVHRVEAAAVEPHGAGEQHGAIAEVGEGVAAPPSERLAEAGDGGLVVGLG